MQTISRGNFIRLTGELGAGLGLAIYLPACSSSKTSSVSTNQFAPNAWVRIAPDNTVTVVINRSEMGQGVATGLPTILADELDASMDLVKVQFAPAGPSYIDTLFGEQLTGGSTSVSDSWMQLRQAGATARAMLITAAAKQWSVDASSLSAKNSSIYHQASNRSASYGSLAVAASSLPVPQHVALKSPEEFTLIGKPAERLDIPAKVNGSAQYGIDVRVPGMMYAAVARCPVFGGSVKSFDAGAAKAIPGVTQVVQISTGVAVVAKNTWAAFQGKNALQIDWDEGPNAKVSTASILADAENRAKNHTDERVAVTRGNPEKAQGTVLEATYWGPFLAHATMEPMNATADVRGDSCEVWAPTQVQTRSQAAAAKASGLPVEKCTVHTTFLGGGFGRRLEADYVPEAVEVSKAINAPVKVMWSREDDIEHDYYRTQHLSVMRGVVSGGKLVAMSHQVVAKSIFRRWFPTLFKKGLDSEELAEAADAPYQIPNFRVTYIDQEHPIPTGNWRAPDANWNAFPTESFIDELAHAAGKDPLEFRLSLLKNNPRAANVLHLAAEKAKWGQKQAGIAQGIAVIDWGFNGLAYAAMVADVSMDGKMPKVHRVVAAVDVGTAITPDIVIQQAQGATNFGLSAALTGKITIQNGRTQQSNFNDYTVLRMAQAPRIDVYIVPSKDRPYGVGEICTPPIAPAVGNAVFVLTGKRVRQLPFSDALA